MNTRAPVSQDAAQLVERLRKLLARATPLPWCWQQCGDKCDDPVIGVAWREDDETYTAIPGYLKDFDAEGNPVEYYRESIAYLGDANNPDASASANAMLIVEVVNALPDLIEALTRPQPSTSSVEAVARAMFPELGKPGYSSYDDYWLTKAEAAIAALPSPEREPLREEWQPLRDLVDAARGLSHGVDWNNGTNAKLHGYRRKLLDALPGAEAALAALANPATIRDTDGECPTCQGRGENYALSPHLPRSPDPVPCDDCHGTGRRDTDEDAVEADMRAYAEAAMQHGWKTAVDAAANGRLVDGWERDWFEQNPPKCARLASSTPAEPDEPTEAMRELDMHISALNAAHEAMQSINQNNEAHELYIKLEGLEEFRQVLKAAMSQRKAEPDEPTAEGNLR